MNEYKAMPMCTRVFRKLDQLAIIDRLELINALLFKHLNKMQTMWKYRLRDPNQVAREKNTQLLKNTENAPTYATTATNGHSVAP